MMIQSFTTDTLSPQRLPLRTPFKRSKITLLKHLRKLSIVFGISLKPFFLWLYFILNARIVCQVKFSFLYTLLLQPIAIEFHIVLSQKFTKSIVSFVFPAHPSIE